MVIIQAENVAIIGHFQFDDGHGRTKQCRSPLFISKR